MNAYAMRDTLRVTKALADIQRIRILMMLRFGELCVCQIVEVLGLAPSTVSKHLSLLATAGLVVCRKDGRWGYYSLHDDEETVSVRPLTAWLELVLARDEMTLKDKTKLETVVVKELDSLCREQRTRN